MRRCSPSIALLLIALTLLSQCCRPHEHLLPLKNLIRREYDFDKIEVDPENHDLQFFNFVTRPDIVAPKWDIEIHNETALAPGYWFVAPYTIAEQSEHDETYVGPYIYDQNGELVWSGTPIFNGYAVFDFQVSNVDGREMLTMIWLHGNSSVMIDEHYQIYKIVQTGRDTESTNMHDFQTIDGSRALYITREPKRTSRENSGAIGFDGHCCVQFTGFEERELSTGELLFTWSPEDHIGLRESMMAGPEGEECESVPWDYFHANSIEKLPDGHYLSSSHRAYALDKISSRDGSIIWRLGGKKSDFEWIGDGRFGGQHDARCRVQNGATEVHSWLLYASDAQGASAKVIASSPRRGFETPLTYWGVAEYVFVEAIARNGSSLGTSPHAATITTPDGLHPAVIEHINWLEDSQGMANSSNVSLTSVVGQLEGLSQDGYSVITMISGTLSCLTIVAIIWAAVAFWRNGLHRWRRSPHSYKALPKDDRT